MKYPLLFFALIGLLLLQACSSGGVSTVRDLADQATKAIIKKDKPAIQQLLITHDVRRDLIKSSNLGDHKKQQALKDLAQAEEGPLAEFDYYWDELYKAMEQAHFDPLTMHSEHSIMKAYIEDGNTASDIFVELSSGHQQAELHLSAIKSGGWYLNPRMEFSLQE